MKNRDAQLRLKRLFVFLSFSLSFHLSSTSFLFFCFFLLFFFFLLFIIAIATNAVLFVINRLIFNSFFCMVIWVFFLFSLLFFNHFWASTSSLKCLLFIRRTIQKDDPNESNHSQSEIKVKFFPLWLWTDFHFHDEITSIPRGEITSALITKLLPVPKLN